MTALHTAGQNSDQSVPLKRYILLFANNLIKLFVQLIVIFVYARALTVLDYGLYQSIWLYVNVLTVFSLFGLPNLILTYGWKSIGHWIRNNKLRVALYFVGINTLPLLYFISHDGLFSWQTKGLIILMICIQNIATIAETLSIKRGADTRVVGISIIVGVLFLVSHIAILRFGYSLPLLLTCLVCIQILKVIVLWRVQPGSESQLTHVNLGRQWTYLGLVDVLSVVYKWLDKWIILFFISISQFAIYFNGSYEIPVFVLMVSAVGNVLLVELSKDEVRNSNRIKHLFTSTTLLLAALVFPAFSFLFFYHEPFFLFFFGDKYVAAIPIFLISIFIIPLRITNFTALLQSSHRADLVLRGVIVDLASAVLLMIFLYPVLGIPGIALAFVLSTYLQAIFYLQKTVAVTQLSLSDFFPVSKLFRLLIISFVATGILYFIIKALSFQYVLPAGVLACLVVAMTLLSFNRKRIAPF